MFWLAEVFNGSISKDEMARAEQWARRERAKTVRALFRGIGRGAAAAGVGIAAWLRKRHELREAARALHDLDDHLLADIGLSRADVDLISRGRWPARLAEPVEEPRLKAVKGEAPRVSGAGDADNHDWQRAA